jgi:hypothetical protein
MKADKLDYLTRAQFAIRQAHNCDAVHNKTVHVHELFEGKTIWKGEVEVFDLDGHAEAKKCYAWAYQVEGNGQRFVTVLEKQLVNSAHLAVKAAIFFGVQPAPHPGPDLQA